MRRALEQTVLALAIAGTLLLDAGLVRAQTEDYCAADECDLCLFGGEAEGTACVAPYYSYDEPEEGDDAEAGVAATVLRSLSPLRIGMSAEEAVQSMVREPDQTADGVKIAFPQIDFAGSFDFLIWQSDVAFLAQPLQLYSVFADDRLVAIWLVTSRREESFAESIPHGTCDGLTDFFKARFGPAGSIAQIEESFFDHSTNVFHEGGKSWKKETRNLNRVEDRDLWIAFHSIYHVYSDFKLNGTHYDHLENCRSQFLVVEKPES